jgi:hypothetical protein
MFNIVMNQKRNREAVVTASIHFVAKLILWNMFDYF